MHKLFPIILICEALSLLMLVLVWYWWWGRGMATQILSIADYCNNLTEYYRKYDKGMRTAVTEATLHREIDNFLEYFAYLLMKKSKQLYVGYIVKWTSLVIVCGAWFAGYIAMFYPGFVVFEDKFLCAVNKISIEECSVPTSTFLRAVWYITIVLLSLLIVIAFLHIFETCRRQKFSSTFFYRTIPGAMDSRLSSCVDIYFNPKFHSLISKFCDANSHLCTNIGLSRSLARKYGTTDGWTPGRETIMDKHYPVIQPEQIRRFRLISEIHFRKHYKNLPENGNIHNTKSKSVHYGKRTVHVHPYRSPRIHNISGKVSSSSGYSTTEHSESLDKISYMTPRLMARKLQKNVSPIHKSNDFQGPMTSTPKGRLTEEELNYFAVQIASHRHLDGHEKSTAVKYAPRNTGNHPKFVSRNRDLNPFAYKLDYTIRKNIAANLNTWKP